MKELGYVAIIIRLFSVFIFLSTINQLVFLVELMVNGTIQGMEASIVQASLNYFPWIAAAFVLWFFPMTIAGRLISGTNQSSENKPISPLSLFKVLVCGISIYLVYKAAMDSVYWLSIWNLAKSGGTESVIGASEKASMYATAIELLVAALMLFNIRKMADLYKKYCS